MIHVSILILSSTGFAMLLLATARHQQEWLRRRLAIGATRILRLSGFMLLALAYLLAGRTSGWGLGAVLWLGWLTIGAGLMVAIQTNRERILARIKR